MRVFVVETYVKTVTLIGLDFNIPGEKKYKKE